MKSKILFAAAIAASLRVGAMLPSDEPLEVQAAASVANSRLKVVCESAACKMGWNSAYQAAIKDEGECSRLTTNREHVEGCKVFVQAAREVQAMQAAVDRVR